MHDLGQIATVIEDQVRGPAIRSLEGLFDTPPEFLVRLALPGENRHAGRRYRRSRLILGREDIARAPANGGAKCRQRFDQNRRLDRHMQATDDAGVLQRLGSAEFIAQRHQAGHFGLGDGNFLAAPVGQGHIGNFIIVLGAHQLAPVSDI